MPNVNAPLETEDGFIYLVKTDTLKGIMWFSYDKDSMINMFPLEAAKVKEIINLNKKGLKAKNINLKEDPKSPEFLSAVGEDSISRFDHREGAGRNSKKRHKKGKRRDSNNDKK